MNQGIDQGVAQRVDAYRGNPQALQQKYAVSQELVDLLALQKIKSEKEAAARQMQLQMGQQQAANGEPPTVAEQREKEVMDMTKQEMIEQQSGIMQQKQQQEQEGMQKLAQGIASAPGAQMAAQPQMMAAGGIVAFAEGGKTDKKEPDAKARAAVEAAQRSGDRDAMVGTLEKLAAAGYDIATLIPRAFMGVAEDLTNNRLGRALGIDFEFPEAAFGGDRESMTPMMDKIRRREAEANQPAPTAPAPTAQQRRPDPLRAQEAEAGIPDGSAPQPEAASPDPRTSDLPANNANPLRPPVAPASLLPAGGAPQKAGARVGLPSLPQESQFGKDVQAGVQGLMNKDPRAMEIEARDEGLEFLRTPGRAEAVAAQQQGLAELDARQLDPEQIRKQKLQNFLLGAGGQGSVGRALGAGGRSAVNFERNRDDEQRRRMLERNKMLRDEFNVEGELRKGAQAAGQARYGEGASDVRQGISSGASMRNTDQTTAASMRNTDVSAQVSMRNADQQMETAGLDRGSRERISTMQAQVQQETSAALRESTSQQRLDQQITRNQQLRLTAEKQARARFQKQIDNIQGLAGMGQKLNPGQITQLDQLTADMETAVRAAVGPIDAQIDRLSGVDSKGGALPPDITDLVKQYPNQGQ